MYINITWSKTILGPPGTLHVVVKKTYAVYKKEIHDAQEYKSSRHSKQLS